MQGDTYRPLSEDIRRERAKILVNALIKEGINFATGVPCAVQKFIIKEIEESPSILHVPAVREGEAIGIATGASIAGKKVVAYMQNSGFLNSIHDINSLLLSYRIPVLFLVTWRGAPGEDAVHHIPDGKMFLKVLVEMRIPFFVLSQGYIKRGVKMCIRRMIKEESPVVMVIKRGVF